MKRLRLPPEAHQAFLAQLREVLREGRLAEADPFHQCPDRQFAGGDQMAQDQQAVLVRQRLHQRGRLASLVGHVGRRNGQLLKHEAPYIRSS
jgi:hypothetical protein